MEADGDTAVAVVDITAPDSVVLVQELVDMTDDLSNAAELEENLKSLLPITACREPIGQEPKAPGQE